MVSIVGYGNLMEQKLDVISRCWLYFWARKFQYFDVLALEIAAGSFVYSFQFLWFGIVLIKYN